MLSFLTSVVDVISDPSHDTADLSPRKELRAPNKHKAVCY
jgi:hypothetical protein